MPRTARVSSWQNNVELIQHEPSAWVCNATRRFWIAAPPGEQEHLALRAGSLLVLVGVRTVGAHEGHDQGGGEPEDLVAPCDPPLDHVLRRPIPPEVGSPRRRDRGQQCALRGRPVQHHESPWARVVGGRGGAGGADGLLDRGARDLTGPERADRSASVERLQGRLPEQVRSGSAHEIVRAPRLSRHRDPADERRGDPGRLPHDRARGSRNLIGHGHHGRLELPTRVVHIAAEVEERRHARDADRHVDEPLAPGSTEGVGDDHRQVVHAEDLAQRSTQRLGRPVGVVGEQGGEPVRHVGTVDAGVRTDETVTCLGDHEVVAPRHDPGRLPLDPPVALGVRHQPALGFGHDLLGHREHVPVSRAQLPERVGEDPRQVIARRHLGEPFDGEDLDRHPALPTSSRAARATSSARASSSMIVSVTPTRSPPASIRGASGRSCSSITHADSTS